MKQCVATLLVLCASLVAAGCSTSTDSADGDAADKLVRVFDKGIGRERIYARPGDLLVMAVNLPDGFSSDDVSWTFVTSSNDAISPESTQDGIAGTTENVTQQWDGDGQEIRIRAPEAGEGMLAVDYGDGESPIEITVEARSQDELVGWGLAPTGKVFVNDGLPVMGEALIEGSTLDTRQGEVSYDVEADDDSATVTYGGVLFRTGIQMEGGEPVAVAIVRRRAEAPEQVMTASVEHASDRKFVRVQTPDALAMVKGTEFTVAVGYEDTTVAVTDGTVAVRQTVLTEAGPDESEVLSGTNQTIVAPEDRRLSEEAIEAAEADPDGWEEDEEPLLAAVYGYEVWADPDDYGFEPEDEDIADFDPADSSEPGLPPAAYADDNGNGIDDSIEEFGIEYGWVKERRLAGADPVDGSREPGDPDEPRPGDPDFVRCNPDYWRPGDPPCPPYP